jgi:hypothetical protein
VKTFDSRSIGIVSGLVALTLFSLPILPAAVAANYTLRVELTITSDFDYFDGVLDSDSEDENGDPIEEFEYIPTKADMASALKDCKAGYNDYNIKLNSTIKVNNESGKVVGLGKLATAKVFQDPDMVSDVFQCKYFGSVKVNSAKFYKLLIDGRNGPDYSFAELKKQKWTVKLSI